MIIIIIITIVVVIMTIKNILSTMVMMMIIGVIKMIKPIIASLKIVIKKELLSQPQLVQTGYLNSKTNDLEQISSPKASDEKK